SSCAKCAGERIVNRDSQTREVTISQSSRRNIRVAIGVKARARVANGLKTKQEEGLVPSVVDFWNSNGTTYAEARAVRVSERAARAGRIAEEIISRQATGF